MRASKKVSMQQIADALSISKTAVSLALNGHAGVSETLREKIYAEASSHGYFSNSHKRSKNRTLLFVMDDGRDREGEFFFPMISSTLRCVNERGYNALISNISFESQNNHNVLKSFYDMRAEGIIFTGNIQKSLVQQCLDHNIPCVLIVQHIYGIPTDTVVSANEDGGYELTRHLIENGHRRIGYIADISVFDSFSRRLIGYRKALMEAQIPLGAYECEFAFTGEKPSENTIGPQMKRILGYQDRPTAWFCGNDHTAIALINEFRKHGIKVPQDVSVVGFDGLSVASTFHPSITTYDARTDLMARYSADLLISHIEKGNENWNPVIVSVLGNLIEGESVRRIDSQ